MQEQRFDHVGVFCFSPEDGTPAAELPNAVPAEVAEPPRPLMEAQQAISAERNGAWVGRIDVLVEQETPAAGN